MKYHTLLSRDIGPGVPRDIMNKINPLHCCVSLFAFFILCIFGNGIQDCVLYQISFK